MEDFEVGEKIIFKGRHKAGITSVTKITKTMVITPVGRFTKGGREVGRDAWASSYIYKATEEEINKKRKEINLMKKIIFLDKVKWKECSADKIDQIVKILQA
jgi:hypothetical protein